MFDLLMGTPRVLQEAYPSLTRELIESAIRARYSSDDETTSVPGVADGEALMRIDAACQRGRDGEAAFSAASTFPAASIIGFTLSNAPPPSHGMTVPEM